MRDAPAEAEALLDALRAAVFSHQRGDIGRDDQTILVLQRLP